MCYIYIYRVEYFVSPRDEALPQVSLECNPEIPVAPGEEHYVLDKSLDEVYFALQWLEGNTDLSLAIRMEDWSSLGQHKGSLNFPL